MDEYKELRFTAPKDFKKGRLILGRFRLIDLIILIVSILFSLIGTIMYITLVKHFHIGVLLLFMLPGVLAYALTFPAGIYHNYLMWIKVYIRQWQEPKQYIWEGVYQHDEETGSAQNDAD